MIADSSPRFHPEQARRQDESGSRHAALASAVAAIRVRRGRMAVEQILLAASAVLFPLGLIFILLGWEGAAHNGHTYAQIDYLISGGLFGLGLSVAGGFMYFGYWLSRQLAESRRQNALTVQALERLEDLLDFAVNSRAAGRPGEDGAAAGRGGAGRDMGSRDSGSRDPGSRDSGSRDGSGRGLEGEVAGSGRRRSTAASGSARGAAARVSDREADRPTGQVPVVGGRVLFATPRGNLLHRAECPVVARRDDLKRVAPGTEGYGYCTMCNAGVPS